MSACIITTWKVSSWGLKDVVQINYSGSRLMWSLWDWEKLITLPKWDNQWPSLIQFYLTYNNFKCFFRLPTAGVLPSFLATCHVTFRIFVSGVSNFSQNSDRQLTNSSHIRRWLSSFEAVFFRAVFLNLYWNVEPLLQIKTGSELLCYLKMFFRALLLTYKPKTSLLEW